MLGSVPITRIAARAFSVPTDAPEESDGTASWTATTLVVAQVEAAGRQGLGYTYSDASVCSLINETLSPLVLGHDALDPPSNWRLMQSAVRNWGREGLAATAVSAVDLALWDLKGVLLDVSLAALLGRYRGSVPIYGSGGFTSYDDRRLVEQLGGWVEVAGCRAVKIKVGRDLRRDPERVHRARDAIGNAALMIDANGAYTRKQALYFAEVFAADDVRWFEEPVSSDDLEGLRSVRDRLPASMELAAGEYGYSPDYFRTMLAAGAVDVQQADATRCGGVTGFLLVAALCEAFHIDLSAHCAPALHLHLGCAAPRFRNIEWFHDHVRIERLLFDGAPVPLRGCIAPDASRPGLGLRLKEPDAARFEVPCARG